MTKSSDGISRRRRRTARRRVLLTLTAVTFAGVLALWPAPGAARQACCVEFTLQSSVVTNFTFFECDAAKTNAGHKALQDVQQQATNYVCPEECPILVEVTAPHLTCVECQPAGARWYGAADAQGTYKCICE